MINTGHCGLKWQERDDIAEDTIMEAIGVFHTKSYSSSCLLVFTLATTCHGNRIAMNFSE